MNTFNAILLFLFLAVLLLILIPLKNCNNKKQIVFDTDTQIVYKYDTIVKFFPKYIPQPIEIIIPNDTVFEFIYDSIQCKKIISDYYTKKIYSDTLRNDSIDIYFNSEIYRNKINSFQIGYKLKFATSTITTIQKNKLKFFIGSSVSSNFNNSVSLGINGFLLDKNENLYFTGVNLSLTDATPFYSVGFAYKLKFNK